MSDLLIKNVGLMLSGDVENPVLDADSIVVKGGLIAEVGRSLQRAFGGEGCGRGGFGDLPRPDRFPLPCGLGGLHASPEDGGLSGIVRSRRRHHIDLRGRGPSFRKAQGPCRSESPRDPGRKGMGRISSGWYEGAWRRCDPRKGPDRGGFR